jgi:hypothetical protein
MKKKIISFTVVSGTAIYILMFIFQVFFRVYSHVKNFDTIYPASVTFSICYFVSTFIFLLLLKNANKYFYYILLPILCAVISYTYTTIRLPGKLFLLSRQEFLFSYIVEDFLFSYLFYGFFTIHIFCWSIDWIITFFYKKRFGKN